MARDSDLDKLMAKLKKAKITDTRFLSDDDSPCVVHDFIPTGCLPLDRIMGGGIPVGRITELHGPPSTGKSLIAFHATAHAQEMGHIVTYADTETAVSIGLMEKIGVDVDNLLYSNPETVEDVFERLDMMIDSVVGIDRKLLFVWDSVAASMSQAEDDKDYGDIGYTTQARVISQSLRKIVGKISKSQVAVLFLNQAKKRLNVTFGDDITVFGGQAIPFHSSVRVRLSRRSKVTSSDKKRVLGMTFMAEAVKNKIVAPYQKCIIPVYFGVDDTHGVGMNDAEACYEWLSTNGYMEGSSHKTMEIEGNEVKFTRSSWPKVYDKYYEIIAATVLTGE